MYVENLSEFEVQTVGDILQLLVQVTDYLSVFLFHLWFTYAHDLLKLATVY